MTKTPGSNPPECFEICRTSEQVERTFDDSRLEDLMVLLLQCVEQSGADKLNNEPVGKTGVKKRVGFPRTLCEPCACLSRLAGAREDPSVWRF